MLDLRSCADCPGTALLPNRWGSPAAAADAFRRELAEHPDRRAEFVAVLLHLLEHASENPAPLTAALVELAPAERGPGPAPEVGQRFADWLVEPIRADGPTGVHLSHLIAAAHLDPAHLPRAAEAMRAAPPSTLAVTAPDYARR
ncbi:MAG: hypothetical protein LBV78_13475, partial [Kitasatospora sp.]|nr:hypothetical protein [Kitasatospora sp.]